MTANVFVGAVHLGAETDIDSARASLRAQWSAQRHVMTIKAFYVSAVWARGTP
jgi:hypothetical protein